MLNVHVRWMIRRDMPEVLAAEAASNVMPWDLEDFVRQLRRRNCIGMVAEAWEPGAADGRAIAQVVGFAVYLLRHDRLSVTRFAVDPSYRRRGVGRALFAKLLRKLGGGRKALDLRVREDADATHLFLRAVGLRATGVDRSFYDDGADAYRFELQAAAGSPCVPRGDFCGGECDQCDGKGVGL